MFPPLLFFKSSWPSGKATGCNPVHAGPNPADDSINPRLRARIPARQVVPARRVFPA